MLSRFRINANRSTVRIERLIAIAAVGLTVVGFAQPKMRSLAGLDFAAAPASGPAIDRMPTGSIALTPQLRLGSDDAAQVHGLAGTLKPLRSKP